jgi:EAL and modified HD-GYP domain-containing signal transduction protein
MPVGGSNVVVGRQSVRDAEDNVIGYELRFDGLDLSRAEGVGLNSHVVFEALTIGMDRLVGDKMLFCDADQDILLSERNMTLMPLRSVLQVTAECASDPEVSNRLRILRARGYLISVDDPDALPGVAGVVRVDASLTDPEALPGLAERIHARRARAHLLGMEDAAQLDEFKDAGFDYFQGYAIEHPDAEIARLAAPSDLARARLASTMFSPDTDFSVIEDILRSEPGMSYQVMQLASIGSLGETRRRVSTLRDALVLAGMWRIQAWVALLLAQPTTRTADGGVIASLVRSRSVEILVEAQSPRDAQMGFAAGMLSSFEELLQVPAEELSRSLPLSEDLREAAFGGFSPIGRIVSDVSEFLRGANKSQTWSGTNTANIKEAVANAYQWAVQVTETLNTPAPSSTPEMARR